VKDRERLWNRKEGGARQETVRRSEFDRSDGPSLAGNVGHRRSGDVDTCRMCNEIGDRKRAREAMGRERDKEKRTAVKKRG